VPRPIELDETIRSAISGRDSQLRLFGWSDAEPWGVRSDAPTAMLGFVPPGGADRATAELMFAPFVPDPT
jgi:hypothetical protein